MVFKKIILTLLIFTGITHSVLQPTFETILPILLPLMPQTPYYTANSAMNIATNIYTALNTNTTTSSKKHLLWFVPISLAFLSIYLWSKLQSKKNPYIAIMQHLENYDTDNLKIALTPLLKQQEYTIDEINAIFTLIEARIFDQEALKKYVKFFENHEKRKKELKKILAENATFTEYVKIIKETTCLKEDPRCITFFLAPIHNSLKNNYNINDIIKFSEKKCLKYVEKKLFGNNPFLEQKTINPTNVTKKRSHTPKNRPRLNFVF